MSHKGRKTGRALMLLLWADNILIQYKGIGDHETKENDSLSLQFGHRFSCIKDGGEAVICKDIGGNFLVDVASCKETEDATCEHYHSSSQSLAIRKVLTNFFRVCVRPLADFTDMKALCITHCRRVRHVVFLVHTWGPASRRISVIFASFATPSVLVK